MSARAAHSLANRLLLLALMWAAASSASEPPPRPPGDAAPPDLPRLAWFPDTASDTPGVSADLSLMGPLPPGVAALVVGVGPVEALADPALCQQLSARRELPRAAYEALVAAFAGQSALLRLDFAPPKVRCGQEVALATCARMADGSLRPGLIAPDQVTPRCGPGEAVVLTPSGPLAPGNLRRGHQLLAYDPAQQRLAVSTLREVPFEGPVRVGVRLSWRSGQAVDLAVGTPVWVTEAHDFVAVEHLQAGQHTLDGELAPREVAGVETLARRRFLSFAARAPGTLFYGGVLIRGGGKATGPRTSPSAAAPPGVSAAPAAPPEVALAPWPASYDCQLGVDLTLRAWPRGAAALRVVSRPHGRVPPGATSVVDCSAWTPGGTVTPAAWEAARATTGGAVRLGLELASFCDGLVDVGLCAVGADGAMTALGPGRMGVAGPSCLAAGTPIATPHGPRDVASLRPGDRVLTWDPDDAERSPAPVARVLRTRRIAAHPTLVLTFDDGVALVATAEHLLYSPKRRGFVRAASLRPGDLVQRLGGARVRLRSVAAGPVVDVWDLTLTAPHTYFAAGVLVHNY